MTGDFLLPMCTSSPFPIRARSLTGHIHIHLTWLPTTLYPEMTWPETETDVFQMKVLGKLAAVPSPSHVFSYCNV